MAVHFVKLQNTSCLKLKYESNNFSVHNFQNLKDFKDFSNISY